ncbi:UDP-galactose-lipid carrier transferase [Candidatus Filomicrobium marinum]|uniref:ADP/GDP-polyphosphate phosphotransferase n=2 Tax=Candidatus Filomicrobium marinum TaxID=1608628 RepID=A0A0D6JCZ7_9HYPH|nr:UDP-galactose-lipid carrier transferase [Candidatus Filomicrobium marinum]CPR17557.1 UDP-galactose-lipid carrier transferase [Candidatus Filomicrobium marinum]
MTGKKIVARAKTGKDEMNKPAVAIDIEQPNLPDGFNEIALKSGGYPYDTPLKRKVYDAELDALHYELVKLQTHVRKTGMRLVIVFEGRDTAGKGGCIRRFTRHLNPRHARVVALSKPNETERGQWYFQRYAKHMPTRGDIVLFDRSWYNRAGVERVMGFCTEDELADFLREAPQFEGMLVRDGICLHKIFLTIGREMQLKRFHERRHNPLKQWKLSDMDKAAVNLWDEYTEAKDEMFRFTHINMAPWTVVRSNDQRRARLEVIRYVLSRHDYEDKDAKAIGTVDPLIVGSDTSFLHGSSKDALKTKTT